MPQRSKTDADRRRSPRFSCGGQAQISRLPSNGIFLPGKIRDLSVGGCCIDISPQIDCGVRTEIVVRVNAASFRAVGEVKAKRGQSGACIEFLQLSQSGQDKLAELLAELEQIQKLVNKLKGAHRDMDPEAFRRELEDGRLEAETLSQRILFVGSILPAENSGEVLAPEPSVVAKKTIVVDEQLRVIQVDLFG
jgi:hypothetical protein